MRFAPSVVALFLLAQLGCAATQLQPTHPTIEFSRQTLTFAPTRDDLTVGCVIFTISSSQPMRVNGGAPDKYLVAHLRQVEKNRFELPEMQIEHSLESPGAVVCMSVKCWFNEVSNHDDSQLYVETKDRYALFCWCLGEPDANLSHRFTENRVASLDEFKQKLKEPIVIRLKDQPLQPQWGYPILQNERVLKPADIEQIKAVVHDRGERFLVSLTGVDADHASVATSIGDATRYHGMRVYKLVRSGGAWQIEGVEEHANMTRFVVW